MPDLDQVVAGLRCRDMLGLLSDYLDRLLPAELTARVEAHLASCPTCARFGSDVATILAALKAGNPPGDSLTAASLGRLRRSIGEAIGDATGSEPEG